MDTQPTRLELELWALGELDDARRTQLEALFAEATKE